MELMSFVLFLFGSIGLKSREPAIRTIGWLLLIVGLSYWVVMYLVPILLGMMYLFLLGPLTLVLAMRKK